MTDFRALNNFARVTGEALKEKVDLAMTSDILQMRFAHYLGEFADDEGFLQATYQAGLQVERMKALEKTREAARPTSNPWAQERRKWKRGETHPWKNPQQAAEKPRHLQWKRRRIWEPRFMVIIPSSNGRSPPDKTSRLRLPKRVPLLWKDRTSLIQVLCEHHEERDRASPGTMEGVRRKQAKKRRSGGINPNCQGTKDLSGRSNGSRANHSNPHVGRRGGFLKG